MRDRAWHVHCWVKRSMAPRHLLLGLFFFAAVLAQIGSPRAALAADAAPTSPPDRSAAEPATPKSDYLFPGSGAFSLSLATGIPFIAMSEVAVGAGNRFAVGALAGIALSGSDGPRNTGFGFRPRVVVVQLGDNRVAAVAPTLYYPIARGSWFLTRPSVLVEHRFANGAFLTGGAGVVVVSTADNLSGRSGGVALPYGGSPGLNAANATNGIWNTLTAGGALPLGPHTQAFADVTLILRGLSLPGDEWIGAVPFTATLGLVTAL
jgi:hypothetical protein